MSTKNTNGTTLDYSRAAARKAALSDIIQHPLTLGPAALGVLGAFGLGLFTVASPLISTGVAIGGILFGGAHCAYKIFSKGDDYEAEHYQRLHEEFEKIKEEKSKQLAVDLKKKGCKQGSLQVEQFEEKLQILNEVFSKVLSPGELTFSRFMGTVEQVYKSAFENLERIVVLLINIGDIDRECIRGRVSELEAKARRTSADERNLKSLSEQAGVYDQTNQEVEELLALNEEALATLDKTGNAAVRIKDRTSTQTTEDIMADAIKMLNQMNARVRTDVSAVRLEQDPKK